jgi:hypothetical protein
MVVAVGMVMTTRSSTRRCDLDRRLGGGALGGGGGVPTDNVASEYPRESKGGMFNEERVGAERRPNERRKRGDCLLLLWLLPPPSWADGAVEEANMMPAVPTAEVQGVIFVHVGRVEWKADFFQRGLIPTDRSSVHNC